MSTGNGRALRILLSSQTRQRLAGAIADCLGGRAHVLVDIEQAVEQGEVDVDLAFISRDVTGRSTKHELAPALQACYDVLRRSSTLRWVHIHSAGADRPIYVELRARGVCITTSSGANAEVVAQSALAGLLALSRRLPQMMAAQRAHIWMPLLGAELPRDLAGQTAVIVGWGPIGQRLGVFLRMLDMRVVVVRTRPEAAGAGMEVATFDEFHSVLPRADWLLLACPLTEKTHRLIDARALSRMPPRAHLVNVARGEVVVESDLVAALQSGQLAGAFLDVFEHEPLPSGSPLWDLPQVMVTPHSAGHSDGNAARVEAMFLRNLRLWQGGRPLCNVAV